MCATGAEFPFFLKNTPCLVCIFTGLQAGILEWLGLIPKRILLPPMHGLMYMVGVMEDYRVFLLESDSP
jgi:hypothetical protein